MLLRSHKKNQKKGKELKWFNFSRYLIFPLRNIIAEKGLFGKKTDKKPKPKMIAPTIILIKIHVFQT